MPLTARRLESFTESVIREMTRVADEHGAINLSQGFPDFDPPKALVEAAVTALHNGCHQYAVTWGAPSFRRALADKQRGFMGLDLDPDAHITVTCGSTEAMMTAMMTVCNPGDKVIVFSPFYENYGADAILAGADPIYVPLYPPDFAFDRSELEAAFRQGARALILCNPANPTGRVFRRDELDAIADLLREFDAFVITDEVYEHIVYEPHRHTYIASLPGMFERTISCSSLSKTYAITGWRLGYLIAPEPVTRAARKVHDFLTVGAPAPLQEAAVTALNFPTTYYDELQQAYAARRDLFLGYLDRAGLKHTVPEGAYYVLVDIDDFGAESDTDFCHWLARDIGVAAVPGSSFFGRDVQRWIRLHFAKKGETLEAAGERLLSLRSKA
ncbi:MAG: aminotransferase class I/II-fold pyridoxal phosphate-dependent enzyme [Anaerolineales bacterium]|jgi:aminotransferase